MSFILQGRTRTLVRTLWAVAFGSKQTLDPVRSAKIGKREFPHACKRPLQNWMRYRAVVRAFRAMSSSQPLESLLNRDIVVQGRPPRSASRCALANLSKHSAITHIHSARWIMASTIQGPCVLRGQTTNEVRILRWRTGPGAHRSSSCPTLAIFVIDHPEAAAGSTSSCNPRRSRRPTRYQNRSLPRRVHTSSRSVRVVAPR